jgi:Fur family peroxide stress response transcriptional regulator
MILNKEELNPTSQMKKEPQARLEELIEKLKEWDYRITPQRLAILKILAVSDGHPSAERIFDQIKEEFPTTSLATVYKTIATLKEMGEVLELGFANDSNRYDGNKPYPHVHLICVKCRDIIDPKVENLEILPQQVAQQASYRLVGHRFDIYGICPRCQREEQ